MREVHGHDRGRASGAHRAVAEHGGHGGVASRVVRHELVPSGHAGHRHVPAPHLRPGEGVVHQLGASQHLHMLRVLDMLTCTTCGRPLNAPNTAKRQKYLHAHV